MEAYYIVAVPIADIIHAIVQAPQETLIHLSLDYLCRRHREALTLYDNQGHEEAGLDFTLEMEWGTIMNTWFALAVGFICLCNSQNTWQGWEHYFICRDELTEASR